MTEEELKSRLNNVAKTSENQDKGEISGIEILAAFRELQSERDKYAEGWRKAEAERDALRTAVTDALAVIGNPMMGVSWESVRRIHDILAGVIVDRATGESHDPSPSEPASRVGAYSQADVTQKR